MVGPIQRYRIKGGHMARAQSGAYCMADDAEAIVAEAQRIRSATIEAIVGLLESIDHESLCDVFDRVGRPKREGEDADLRDLLDEAQEEIRGLRSRLASADQETRRLAEIQRRAAESLRGGRF